MATPGVRPNVKTSNEDDLFPCKEAGEVENESAFGRLVLETFTMFYTDMMK